MKKSDIINRAEDICCGCCMCQNACPVNAIQMHENNEGFLEPNIDSEKCIDCRLCNKICPTNQSLSPKGAISTYAMQSKNREMLLRSSSGGFFGEVAKFFLEHFSKSVVVGAMSLNDGSVKHIMISQSTELYKLQKSKYAQSDLSDIILTIKRKLDMNYSVMFVGTPCQISGLKSYLGNQYDKLLCIDFICHGVPNSKFWVDYTNDLGEIKSADFRNKETGWRNYSLNIVGEKKEIKCLHYKDSYMISFLKNLSLRESCYQCKYKNDCSDSDITIGDFWGIEKLNTSTFIDDLGVSFVQSNTIFGEKLINEVKDKFLCIIVENGINRKLNTPQYESVVRPEERNDFFQKIYINNKLDMRKLESITQDSLIVKIKRKIKKVAVMFERGK